MRARRGRSFLARVSSARVRPKGDRKGSSAGLVAETRRKSRRLCVRMVIVLKPRLSYDRAGIPGSTPSGVSASTPQAECNLCREWWKGVTPARPRGSAKLLATRRCPSRSQSRDAKRHISIPTALAQNVVSTGVFEIRANPGAYIPAQRTGETIP